MGRNFATSGSISILSGVAGIGDAIDARDEDEGTASYNVNVARSRSLYE